MPKLRWTTLTLDCADAVELAEFWCALLGWDVTARNDDGWLQARDPRGGVGLNFQADPAYRPPTWPEEPELQTKQMHFEVLVDDLEAAVERVLAGGGREAEHQPADRDPERLRVMLDPAGHPFCLYVRGE